MDGVTGKHHNWHKAWRRDGASLVHISGLRFDVVPGDGYTAAISVTLGREPVGHQPNTRPTPIPSTSKERAVTIRNGLRFGDV